MFERPEDIAFVISPSIWYKSLYPTGILCLANYLEARGFRNVILDGGLSPKRVPPADRERLILERLKASRPRVICLSSTHREFEEVVRLGVAAKAMDPRTAVIVGGSQATYRKTDFLDNGIDFVCFGEGEKTLLEFVQAIAGGKTDWTTVSGLAWRKGGRVVVNAPRELLTEAELDSEVFSAYEKIDRRYFDVNVEIVLGSWMTPSPSIAGTRWPWPGFSRSMALSGAVNRGSIQSMSPWPLR